MEPGRTTGGTPPDGTPPDRTDDGGTPPDRTDDGGTPPDRTDDGGTAPDRTDDGGAVPDRTAVADALPGARAALRRALADAEAGRDPSPVLAAVVEAAGGPDAGNAVRAQLERTAVGAGAPRGVLAAARRLHEDTDRALRAALERAGLGAAADPARRERAEFARRTLDARAVQVAAVLDALEAEA